jgi:kumamolisin
LVSFRWGSPQWAGILAIGDQKAGYNLGFINKALYHIGQAQQHHAASFFAITTGNHSVPPYVNPGPNAGPGWDATTGLGSPKADGLVDYLIQFVSPGDGTSAIAGSKPRPLLDT